MTLYEIYGDTNWHPVQLVHCVRCGGEYPPTDMILIDMGVWVCPSEGCHGTFSVSVFPITTESDPKER